jgi:hypothetical protein
MEIEKKRLSKKIYLKFLQMSTYWWGPLTRIEDMCVTFFYYPLLSLKESLYQYDNSYLWFF